MQSTPPWAFLLKPSDRQKSCWKLPLEREGQRSVAACREKCLQRSENSPYPHQRRLFPRKRFHFSFASVLMRWTLEQNIHKREKEREGDWKSARICRGYAKWRLNWFRLSQRINSWGSTAGHLENPKPHTYTHNWLNFIILTSNQFYTDISIQMPHIHHPNHRYREQMCVYKHPACPSVNEPLWKPSCVERRRWGHFFWKAFKLSKSRHIHYRQNPSTRHVIWLWQYIILGFVSNEKYH